MLKRFPTAAARRMGFVHLYILGKTLANKTLLEPLQKVLHSVIKIVNYIKSGTRLFKYINEFRPRGSSLLYYRALVAQMQCFKPCF